MKKRRSFTKDYKLSAIQPMLDGERSISQQSNDLGIHRSTLQSWLEQYRELGEKAFTRSGTQSEEQLEILRLRRQLDEKQAEIDILKKARDYLGKAKR